MAERVKIKYGDVAPEAKENFSPIVNDKMSFVDLSELQQYNLRVGNYANPCELYQTILDGSQEVMPEDLEVANMGLWSNSMSGADGRFAEDIVLTLESVGKYSSQGLTFTFDTENNIFPKLINIKWYQDGELMKDEQGVDLDIDFSPDSAFYFCRKKVDYYNKVVVTFQNLNMPHNRLKLRVIDYGYGTFFYGDELRNVKLIQEIDPLSESIIINTCDFTLDSKTDMQYSFQSKQPLAVYFNNELKATVFVEKSKRKSEKLWEINAEDYVAVLDNLKFMGGMYTEQNAFDLLTKIFEQAKVPFTMSDNLKSETITGYIPICTCREALQKICFAIGAVADTSNSETLNVFKLSTEISQSVPKNRIMQGQSFEDRDRITAVQVTQHSFVPLTGDADTVELYKASESGGGDRLFVEFSEPMHSLSMPSGVIHDSGANYAIITTDYINSVLYGKPYNDTKTVVTIKDENIGATELENIKTFDDTLISVSNVDKIAQSCYDYYRKTNKVIMSIVDGKSRFKYGSYKYGGFVYGQYGYDKPVNVGDMITAETGYLGTLQGRISSARYSLDGGIIVKECEMV